MKCPRLDVMLAGYMLYARLYVTRRRLHVTRRRLHVCCTRRHDLAAWRQHAALGSDTATRLDVHLRVVVVRQKARDNRYDSSSRLCWQAVQSLALLTEHHAVRQEEKQWLKMSGSAVHISPK